MWIPADRIVSRVVLTMLSMAYRTSSLMLVICAAGLFAYLSADETVAADEKASSLADAEYFEAEVRPILARRCYSCHSSDKGADNGDLILETVEGIAAGGSRGSLFSKDDLSKSLLLHSLSYLDVDLQMPPEGKLPINELMVLERWVTTGAQLPEYTVAPRPKANSIDLDAGRKFWSFQPLQQPPVPDAASMPWGRNSIDAFVAKQLEANRLTPSAEASRSVLLRRLTFNLIGLPPTPEELEAFEQDESPQAFERVVDRLLASPHYGERWARVWLDLARYTDFTPEWQSPTDRGWMYRDWVVQALNTNMPYDQFVRLQLAGDLIPNTDPKDLAALGFIGLSPTYWKELQLAPAVIEQIVADEWDERIDAVSRTFMGLTISCARCHDHKFDPISIEDYYSLAGIFASTQLDERPLVPSDEAAAIKVATKQLKELEEKLKTAKEKSPADAPAIQQQIDQLKVTTPHLDLPWAHVVREASVFVQPDGTDRTRLEYREGMPRDLPVFRRGNPSNPGDVMARRFPAVLQRSEPSPYTSGSGRRELANQLLTDAQGLVARVFVNRIWGQHFGEGLVRTPSDFGVQGDRPTHPELLEHLACDFVAHGWDIKWLHRQIVMSATWRQSSAFRENAHAADPSNHFLWRFNRRRLDLEMWRDAVLAANGRLDQSMGGPSLAIDDPKNVRRTIYVTVAREELHPTLRMHDFPEASSHSPQREPTTTPLQQLFFLNSPWMKEQSAALLNRLQSLEAPDSRIELAYRLLFSRKPNAEEMAVGLEFVNAERSDSNGISQRWADYLQCLLSLNEFHFAD